jgi:hypothetical protein
MQYDEPMLLMFCTSSFSFSLLEHFSPPDDRMQLYLHSNRSDNNENQMHMVEMINWSFFVVFCSLDMEQLNMKKQLGKFMIRPQGGFIWWHFALETKNLHKGRV